MQKVEMIWIDLETTGLDANTDVPLEVGLVLTDKWGNVIDEKDWLVWEPTYEYSHATGRAVKHEIVGEMHTRSGLWEDLHKIEASDNYTRELQDEHMCDWLDDYDVKAGTIPMAGSSVGSLDRPFVLRHFPKLNVMFHYRNIDVSSIKEMAKLLNPNIAAHTPESKDEHRVLSDARGSIELYKYFCTEFLIVDEELE